MLPAEFDYHRASTVAEALDLLDAHADLVTSEAAANVGDPDAVASAAERAAANLDHEQLIDDTHASGEFRAHLLGPYAEQAVGRALERATGGERR